MDLFELADAIAERNAGMQIAADNADAHCIGWTDEAYQWIRKYARQNKTFISEQCTAWAAEQGFRSPTDPRAWGQPFRRAAKDGIIVRVGYGTSLRRHCSPTPKWESAIFKVAA